MTSHITMERRGEYSRALQPNYQSVKQWLVSPDLLFSLIVAQINKSNAHTHLCTYAHIHRKMLVFAKTSILIDTQTEKHAQVYALAHMKM